MFDEHIFWGSSNGKNSGSLKIWKQSKAKDFIINKENVKPNKITKNKKLKN